MGKSNEKLLSCMMGHVGFSIFQSVANTRESSEDTPAAVAPVLNILSLLFLEPTPYCMTFDIGFKIMLLSESKMSLKRTKWLCSEGVWASMSHSRSFLPGLRTLICPGRLNKSALLSLSSLYLLVTLSSQVTVSPFSSPSSQT